MTMSTATTPEMAGRALAEIAFEMNEFGPPDYRKLLRAFMIAGPWVEQVYELASLEEEKSLLPDGEAGNIIDGVTRRAFDERIRELGAEAGLF